MNEKYLVVRTVWILKTLKNGASMLPLTGGSCELKGGMRGPTIPCIMKQQTIKLAQINNTYLPISVSRFGGA